MSAIGLPQILKSNTMKTIFKTALILLVSVNFIGTLKGQESFQSPNQKSIAVMAMETSNIVQESGDIESLAALKLQSIPNVIVPRKYDVIEHFNNRNISIDNCLSTKCLVEEGRAMEVDYVLTGSVTRYGERIIIQLSLIDIEKGEIRATDQNEYYNLGSEIEGMMEISMNNLFDIESDAMLKNALEKNSDLVDEQIVERINLTGPRMGIGYVGGLQGQRLMDSKSNNGYGMFPVMTQFGYQFEWQYMSAGNMQALIEFIPLISGMDQGRFIPSVTLMNGFRHSRTGWEFAFGPTFRLNQTAEGYYDGDGVWRRTEYWEKTQGGEGGSAPDNPFYVHENIDSKGDYKLNYGFTLAAGKTFKSGHLNMPINVYVTPSINGVLAGASFGFNVRKRSKNI